MQIKSVLVLLVVGAVAVLAKKGSSEEKDGNGYTWNVSPRLIPLELWGKNSVHLGNRPGRRPQQPAQGISVEDMKNFLGNISGEMQQVSIRAYSEFQLVESQIDRNKKNVESGLFSQLQNIESLMASKESREIQQALKQGKNEEEIKNCIEEEEPDFKIEMKGDVQRTMNCVNDATERARQIVSEARNSFSENSIIVAMQYKSWAFQLSSCVYRNDLYCTQQYVSYITEKTRTIVDEANRQIEKLQDASRQQTIQLDYCQQNFQQDIKGMRLEYMNIVKECVEKSSDKKPEKNEEEENSSEVEGESD